MTGRISGAAAGCDTEGDATAAGAGAVVRLHPAHRASAAVRAKRFNIGGVNTPATETPITPVIVGEGRAAMEFSLALFDEGVMGTGIAFPTVPEGKARIRLILTSEHTKAQLDEALETLERVAKRMGILEAAEA